MILFHGTTEIVEKPDISFSKSYLDFGKGFYLTTYQKQAEKWALRKGLRKQKPAIVNVYDLSDDLEKYDVLRFNQENEKWLDFVCACRKGDNIYRGYDIIIGAVANDDVFKTIVRYYKMNDQICIINQDVLDKELIFQKAYQVSQDDK